MTKQFRERFHPKDCPKCGELIIPVTNGESNEMHGYKLHCPECKSFIGWGGKADVVFHKKD